MISVLTVNWTNSEGGTVGIINCIENRLSDRCRFIHCFQVGDLKNESDFRVAPWIKTKGYYLLSRLTGIKYGLGNIPTAKLIRYIKRVNPDIVHIHCPNFYSINLYKLFKYLKEISRRI